MSLQQAQLEGLCLRYPENFASHATITYENAVNMLLRAVPLSLQTPYNWTYIDKPGEGQIFLLYLQSPTAFPNDGVRWQDQETRGSVILPNGRELEVMEIKFGFVPGSQDNSAWRVRRRYRLLKGGHPQLVLVHYTRGQAIPIAPTLLSQPVRSYPLRPFNDPPVFVIGDKKGQMVIPHGMANAPPQQGIPGMNPNINMTPQAMLAQQNSAMEALERRAQRAVPREGVMNAASGHRQAQARIEEEDSADETDHISTRTLAQTRYKRNHELMNEVFRCAAFPDRATSVPPSPYSIFDKAELESKIKTLSSEVEELQRVAELRKAKCRTEDVSLAIGEGTMGHAENAIDVGMEAL